MSESKNFTLEKEERADILVCHLVCEVKRISRKFVLCLSVIIKYIESSAGMTTVDVLLLWYVFVCPARVSLTVVFCSGWLHE